MPRRSAAAADLQLAAVGIFSDKRTQDMNPRTGRLAIVQRRRHLRQDGLATTDQAPADATVTATDPHSGISGSLNIEIPLADYAQVLVDITVTAPRTSIEGGGKLGLTATGRYADGSPRDLTASVRRKFGFLRFPSTPRAMRRRPPSPHRPRSPRPIPIPASPAASSCRWRRRRAAARCCRSPSRRRTPPWRRPRLPRHRRVRRRPAARHRRRGGLVVRQRGDHHRRQGQGPRRGQNRPARPSPRPTGSAA